MCYYCISFWGIICCDYCILFGLSFVFSGGFWIKYVFYVLVLYCLNKLDKWLIFLFDEGLIYFDEVVKW